MAAITHLPPQPRGLTAAQHAALLLVLLVHSAPFRALRDAVLSLSSAPLPRDGTGETASRSVSTFHKSAAPGVDAPSAAVSRDLSEIQDMHSLPHAVDVGAHAPAPGATLHDLRPKQHTAVMRWFCNLPLSALDTAITQNPAFPLIDCNPEARAFAPARGKPAPAPAPNGGAA